jgi:hypothetical protein
LKALIDSGSDFNILNKDSIPSCYWLKNNNATIGLGNQTLKMEYEVERVKLCFGPYYLNMKFSLAKIPVPCLLGTPLLVVVEPHGYEKLPNGKFGFFITIARIKIVLPFVSVPKLSTMVQMSQNLIEKEKNIQELQQMNINRKIDQHLKELKIQDRISQLQKRFED